MEQTVTPTTILKQLTLKNLGKKYHILLRCELDCSKYFKNTDGTSGINACGVDGSGSDDASCLNENIDNEARKIQL